MLRFAKYMAARFKREESGLALTEYLVLLGLLIGGVLAAVILVGGDLAAGWQGWTTWFDANVCINSAGAKIACPES